MKHLVVVLICMACALLVSQVNGMVSAGGLNAQIYGVSPTSGSIFGGTMLTITGVGFMRDDTQGVTTVFFGNEECPMIEYYTTDNIYVCITPASPIIGAGTGSVPITMVTIGTGYADNAACLITGAGCVFSYTTAATPILNQVSFGGAANGVLNMQGFLLGSLLNQMLPMIGEYNCPTSWIDPILSVSQTLNVEPLTTVIGSSGLTTNGGTYTLWCLIPEQPAGRFVFSLQVIANPATPLVGYGYEQYGRYVTKVADDGSLYNFIQQPTVTSIFPKTGGLTGGGLVTISGASFGSNCSNINVIIAGQAATLVSCATEQLIVKPAANTDATVRATSLHGSTVYGSSTYQSVPGSSGVRIDVISSSSGQVTLSYIGTSGFNIVSQPHTQSASYSGARLTSLFVAPYTARYQFYCNGDLSGTFKISSDASTGSLVSACSSSSNNAYYTGSTQVSQWFNLTAGKSYAVAGTWSGVWNNGYNTQGSYGVAVRIQNSNSASGAAFLPTDTYNHALYASVPTIQTISIVSTSIVRAVQLISISGFSGGFVQVQSGTSTASALIDIANGTTSQIVAAIQSISSCSYGGSISVVRTVPSGIISHGVNFNITWNCPSPSGRSTLSLNNVNLTGDSTQTPSISVTVLAIPSLPLGGTFRLGFGNGTYANDQYGNLNGDETGNLAPTASAATVQSQLIILTGIESVLVASSGYGYDSMTYTITFLNPPGNVPCLDLYPSLLTGAGASMKCTITQMGSLDRFINPIPSDWLSLPADNNQVIVSVNGISSICQGSNSNVNYQSYAPSITDCAYIYNTTLTPTLTAVTNGIGAGNQWTSGQALTLTGSGFNAVNVLDNVVNFLPAFDVAPQVVFNPCNVRSVSADGTQLICYIPDLSAGPFIVQVQVLSRGVTTVPSPLTSGINGAISGIYVQSITSYFPKSGSQYGGSLLFIFGTGFHIPVSVGGSSNDSFTGASYNPQFGDQISIGTQTCILEDVSFTRIVCRVPPMIASLSATQVIYGNANTPITGTSANPSTWVYSSVLTPQILSVYPTAVSAAVATIVTIQGTGFVVNMTTATTEIADLISNPYGFTLANHLTTYDNSLFATFAVHFGTRSCNIMTVNSTTITCLITSGPSSATSSYSPSVYVLGQGYANANGNSVDIALRVSSVSPNIGSLAGGQSLTITGAGFVSLSSTFVQIDIIAEASVANYTSMNAPNLTPPVSTPISPSTAINGSVSFPTTIYCDIVSLSWSQIICVTESSFMLAQDLGSYNSIVGSIHVTINQISSICSTADIGISCAYGMAPALTPVITGISPKIGGSNQQLTITGSGLGRALASVSVYIGFQLCPVSAVNSTQITCTMPGMTAGTFPVQVLYSDVGFAANDNYNRSSQNVTFKLSIQSITYTGSSYGGGVIVTLSGNGFSPNLTNNQVVFGNSGNLTGVSAIVLSSSYGTLTFLTPPSASAWVATSVSYTSNFAVGVTGVYYAYYNVQGVNNYNPYPLDGNPNPPLSSSTIQSICGANSTSTGYSCFVTYTSTSTPHLSSISPRTGVSGTTLSVVGRSLGVYNANNNVEIGGVGCAIVPATWNSTFFQCIVGYTPAGSFPVVVTINGMGVAYVDTSSLISQTTYISQLAVTSVGPTLTSGYGGGIALTIHGSGFSSSLSTNVVSICNTGCAVTSSNYSTIICTSQPLNTLDRMRAFGVTNPQIATGTPFGSMGATFTTAQLELVFDNNPQTWIASTSDVTGHCYVGLDMGPFNLLALTQIQYFPPWTQAALVAGGYFQSSNDLVNWNTVANISSNIYEAQNGWSYFDIVNVNLGSTVSITSAQRYFRYVGPPGGSCVMAEMQFIGYVVANNTANLPASSGVTDIASCPIYLQVNAPDTTHVQQVNTVASSISNQIYTGATYTYSLSATPRVSNISPNNGTSLGGTLVTISGVGFTTSSVVALSGYPCTIVSVNSTSIQCRTTKRSFIGPSPSGKQISVLAGSAGFAILVADTTLNTSPLMLVPILPYFRYIDLWSSLNSWTDNIPPSAGDTVVIPVGQTILMDVSPPQLNLLLIQGVLIWDPTADNLQLNASYIWVNGGTFQVGTEQQPFMNRATITLFGDRLTSIELPYIGSKVLNVGGRGASAMPMGSYVPYAVYNSPNSAISDNYDNMDGRGILDIHGIPRMRVWTKVAVTVPANQSIVITSEPVDFQPGETLVLTSGSGNMYEAEVVTVYSLINPYTINLTAPVQFEHKSYWYNVTGYNMDMRCEIALLSRNIVIRGEPISSDLQQYGSHTMMTAGGIMRVENAEVNHCGQSFNLGRYCLHFHMAGDASESYVKSNSIHRSYQRATTVHGTQLTTVQNEVAYDVKGHTFFVEDGAERENLFEGNLGILTQPLYTMLASDTEPSTFWMSSPSNSWRHNVAAGSAANGFWFELPANPGGPSYTTSVCPFQNPLGQFYNNTAKNNNLGLKIYPQWLPMLNPCSGDGITSPQYLYNTTSFRNSGNGIFNKHIGDIHHINIMLAENGDAQYSQVHYEGVGYKVNNFNVVNGLFVADTTPTLAEASSYPVAIFAPQEEFWTINGAVFVNYQTSAAITGCNMCDSDESFKQGGYTYETSNFVWINSTVRVTWTSPYKEIWHDVDGSLTGYVGGQATPYKAYNIWPECQQMGANFSLGIVCNGQVRARRLQVQNYAPATLAYQIMKISGYGSGADTIPFRPKDYAGWAAVIIATKTMNITLINGNGQALIDWTQLQTRYSEPEYVRDLSVNVNTEFASLSWPYIDYRWNYKVYYPGDLSNLAASYVLPYQNMSINSLAGYGFDYTVPMATNTIDYNHRLWNIVINSNNANSTLFEEKYQYTAQALVCSPTGCPIPSIGNWSTPVYWSSASSWSFNTYNGGNKPLAGQQVVIPSNVWMILDENTPNLGQIVVNGYLQFQDFGVNSNPLLFNCTALAVFGLMTIGTAQTPYQGNAILTIRGNRYSPSLIVDNSQALGNKVMFVAGNLTMYGNSLVNTWTRLQSTASVGVSTISVQDSISDWTVGSKISISSTEYDVTQAETVVITSIDATNRLISFSPTLRYSHFGGDVKHGSPNLASYLTTATQSAHFGAVVALLSRNIVIQGDSSGSDGSVYGYGGQIVVSEIPGSSTAQGTINAQYVQFDYMGQQNMTGAAIAIHYFTAADAALYGYTAYYYKTRTTVGQSITAISSGSRYRIIGCAFSNSQNYGIYVDGAQGVVLDRNVVQNSERFSIGFSASSYSAIITNNAVIGSFRSPADFSSTLGGGVSVIPMSAIYVIVSPAQLTGNIVAGAQDSAFTLRLPSCTSGYVFGQNEAISSMHGMYILPDAQSSNCVMLNDFVVWKSSSVGILSVDLNTNVKLVRVLVSDSHVGISLEFSNVGDPTSSAGLPVSSNSASISQSVIMGSTTASSCSASVQCVVATNQHPFVTAAENIPCESVFGSTYRRIGIVSTQYFDIGRTCEVNSEIPSSLCTFPSQVNLPVRTCATDFGLIKRYGLPSTARAQFNLSQVTFANWASSDCGLKSAAVAWAPYQPDYTPIIFSNLTTWTNTTAKAKLSVQLTPNGYNDNLGTWDGLLYFTISDQDGSFAGYPVTSSSSPYWSGGHTIVSGANSAFASGENCTYNTDWNAFYCLNTVYRQAVIQSLDRDAGTRNLQPVIYTKNNIYSPTAGNQMYFSEGPIDDMCPIIMHFAFFTTLFRRNQWTDIYTTGTTPNYVRTTIQSYDPNEKFLLSMLYEQPFQVLVFRGSVAQTNVNRLPTLSDPVGSYTFDPQARRVYVVAGGGSLNSVGGFDNTWDFVVGPQVQVTMTLAVDYSEFDSARLISYLGLLLSIDPSQIRVVNVHSGSTVASITISPKNNVTANATANYLAAVALNDVANNLAFLINNGTEIGYPVESATIIPASINATDSQVISAQPYTKTTSSGLSNAAIGGIIAGVVIGLICLFMVVLFLYYRSTRKDSLPDGWDVVKPSRPQSVTRMQVPASTNSDLELVSINAAAYAEPLPQLPLPLPPAPNTAPALPRRQPTPLAALTTNEISILNRPAPRPKLPTSKPNPLRLSGHNFNGRPPPLPTSKPTVRASGGTTLSYAAILRKLARDAAVRARAKGWGGRQDHEIDHHELPDKYSPSSSDGSAPGTPVRTYDDESVSRIASVSSAAASAAQRRQLPTSRPVMRI